MSAGRAPFPSWTLRRGALALRVWELGDPDRPAGDRPPVICLHGWLDQGLGFARLAGGRAGRWIAPDQRGFGGSSTDALGGACYPHFADFVADLDALVEAVGTAVDLVGHSMGGTVAALYAGARPERVRRVVLLDGLGALPTSERSQLRRMRRFLAGQRRPPHLARMASVEQAARRLQERHPGLDAGHAALLARHGTRPAEPEGVRWSFDPLHLVRGPHPFHEEGFTEVLAAVEAPVLLLWARRGLYPPAFRERRAAHLRRRVERELDCGHMIPYERPVEAGDLVERFLAAPDGAPEIP